MRPHRGVLHIWDLALGAGLEGGVGWSGERPSHADRGGTRRYVLPMVCFDNNFYCISLMLLPAFVAVAPIDEVARATELLLGPYSSEEHAKRALVVREPRLNRAYLDPEVRLAERQDPDEGWKKQACVPDEGDAGEPIDAVPLRAVGIVNLGVVSCARVDAAGRSAKWDAPGTLERVASARSSGSSSAVRGSSPALGGAAGVAGRDAAA